MNQEPNLLYLGSLAVEATSAGQLQLYRLLRSYPSERLRVIETEGGVSRPERRLPEVSYLELKATVRRGWVFSRKWAPEIYWWALQRYGTWQARRALGLLGAFRPSAILTIHDGLGWLTAHKLSVMLSIPLHLVLHDDWFRHSEMPVGIKARFESYFGEVYQAAVSRLCVSPFMEEDYARCFGAEGSVLYPIRTPQVGPHMPRGEAPASMRSDGLTIAYAGNIFNLANWQALRHVADSLAVSGGRLLLFGPMTASDCREQGLERANVSVRGFLDQVELREVLSNEVDILFLPMSFDKEEERNMRLCFPSKLADYTDSGLPILIYGPSYCSAVRWAESNPGAAEVVTRPGRDALSDAIVKLSDGCVRRTLGRKAVEAGDRYFAYEAGSRQFHSAITAVPKEPPSALPALASGSR